MLEKAQREYKVVERYVSQSINAAENLIIEFEATMELICKNPDRWRNEYKNYRELAIRKYPYVIIYTIEENELRVIVTALFHMSKNPKKSIGKINAPLDFSAE